MSGVYKPPEPLELPEEPSTIWSGKKRVLAAAALLAGLGLSFVVFTGKIDVLGWIKSAAPPAAPLEYQANTRTTLVDHVKPAAFSQPKPQTETKPKETQAKPPPPAEGLSAAQLALLNSPIHIYTTGATPAAASTQRTLRGSEALDGDGGDNSDPFTRLLKPSVMESAEMQELPSPRWMIQQGRMVQCTQITRYQSTIPGMVSSFVGEPGQSGGVRGDTGDVILLPNGSRMVGVAKEVLLNGANRVAILWLQITTPVLYDKNNMPHHFRVNADSPFTDPLGTAGADGEVDHHWMPKIGAIVGASVLNTGGQYLVAKAQQNNTSNTQVNLGQMNSGTETVTAEFLRSIINIPDVLTRSQGRECAMFLSRDLLMKKDYQLFLLDKYGS